LYQALVFTDFIFHHLFVSSILMSDPKPCGGRSIAQELQQPSLPIAQSKLFGKRNPGLHLDIPKFIDADINPSLASASSSASSFYTRHRSTSLTSVTPIGMSSASSYWSSTSTMSISLPAFSAPSSPLSPAMKEWPTHRSSTIPSYHATDGVIGWDVGFGTPLHHAGSDAMSMEGEMAKKRGLLCTNRSTAGVEAENSKAGDGTDSFVGVMMFAMS
jgi:hypothetical protein